MKKTNILVIDKNVLVRQAVAQVLQREQSFGVVAICDKVEDASRQIMSRKPDVVLLDVDSQDSEGLAILNLIRVRYPDLPVVALSSRTEEGATAAIMALQLGAVDVVTKPEHPNSVLFAGRHFRKRVIPIVKVAAELGRVENRIVMRQEPFVHSTSGHSGKETGEREEEKHGPVRLIVIGGGTGGPRGLFSIIPRLPADFPLPVVIVQHFPKIYTAALADKLNELAKVTVREVEDGMELTPGTVWIAAGGYHCEIARSGSRDIARIHRGQRENTYRPSIDGLFRSASRMYGSEVLGVVLSGCSGDALTGSEIIKKAGGYVLVQDPKTALAQNMPRSVIRAGVSNEYYSVDELTNQLIRHANRSREAVSGKRSGGKWIGKRTISDFTKNQKDLFV